MIPKLKFDDFIVRINQYLQQPNEFQLRAIERDAKALKQFDLAGAYLIFGILAAIQGDLKAAILNHEHNLSLANTFENRFNYLTSLERLGQLNKALEQVDLLLFTPRPEVLMTGMQLSIRAAQPNRAKAYYYKLLKLLPELADDKQIETDLSNTLQLFRATGLSDMELSELNTIAQTVIADFGATVSYTSTLMNQWEAPYFVTTEFKVQGADPVDMLFELAERLAEKNPPALQKGGYHVTFSAASA
ncbi:MAG: hypothetical protein QJT80_06780 [Candidatus Thiocaldithrix dubininis]|jgi:tetratricopeptide (TPR) repeat protein|uniref:Tetratricopeptide repeat protein n=1 Tax=Candidatus Thiocaldithrix dubininis TaxID=3080823 RepID=A0AA95H7T1_9GAMM|nr:MAG: hypothetical protein QJT80_06780 [Candidatus Thiocaldithrix dubininis]